MATDFTKYHPNARLFLDYVNASVTPFHAVATTADLLKAAGFERISERDKWAVKPGGKYYFTRNQTTIVAFAVGGKYTAGNGFSMAGAHTDSCNFKVKPVYDVQKGGCVQVGVEPYGGGLWGTWFDRDLTVAGRVIVKQKDGTFGSRLVHIQRPILRIPTLAIHLDRDAGTKFEFNKQAHLLPILATAVKSSLGSADAKEPPVLLQLLSRELGVDAADIRDFELSLVDTQKAVLGGVFEEFIYSPRLDNLNMSFCSIQGLISAVSDSAKFAQEKNVLCVTLFDHEEVGSESAHGAASPIVSEIIRRVTGDSSLVEQAIRRSFFVSADMAHALHPNYQEKHEPYHQPFMQKGVVIKLNCNQRYATTAVTSFYLKEIARRYDIPLQEFVVRNDSACGSTIGPIVSAHTGLRTVDIGNPQLSMHSIREMMGVVDVTHAVNLLKAFFQDFSTLDDQVTTD